MLFSFGKPKPVTADLSFLAVDMHSHLLPGIDDGLQTVADTVAYMQALQAMGYKKFICTPHILNGVHNNSPETILPQLAIVREALKQHGVNVEVAAAAEYMIDDVFEQYIKEGKPLLTFGDQYILVEMSYMAEATNLYSVLYDLTIKGLQPILAHPERYNYFHKQFDQYYEIKNRNTLFQVNILSLSGYYGKQVKQTAERLIKEKMVEFIGTDMHHANHLKATQDYTTSAEFYKLTKDIKLLNNTL
ncbi:tyrosine-protein phosphatase [Parasediminibacterium paludis]|uniref:protein-tyrosine-phosphatase n=1 Tax=Parasediminibacterium paludis TaxID=908966 RepID=A0ABV8Q055_9BACT